MAEITFTPPTAEDVETLARGLRQADIDELHAQGETDLKDVVAAGVRDSVHAWTCAIDGRLLFLAGVAPLRPHLLCEDIGVPWLLGTEEMPRHARKLIRLQAPYIALMLSAFPRLVNMVHAENVQSVRWLKSLGFCLQPAQPHGPYGAPFRVFTMGA